MHPLDWKTKDGMDSIESSDQLNQCIDQCIESHGGKSARKKTTRENSLPNIEFIY